MENLHLLKVEMSFDDYLAIPKFWKERSQVVRFPFYTVAICPLCNAEITEHLNTYSAKEWNVGYGSRLFSAFGPIYYCEHYVLSHFFINFHGFWPNEARGEFTPEVPHVIGHILEDNSSLAVMHALPMCRPENGQFVPRYTLYLMTYFSEKPHVLREVTGYNATFFEESTGAYLVPPEDCHHWWDLPRWVSEKRLYWLDASTDHLHLRTSDVPDFPYKNITGRRATHQYPFPYPPSVFR